MRYLDIPDDDPWDVSRPVLAAIGTQPTGTGEKSIEGGKLVATCYENPDGRQAMLFLGMEATPGAITPRPRYPTIDELMEAIDRLIPLGWHVTFPLPAAGQHGINRPDCAAGESLQVLAANPNQTKAAPLGVT